MTSSSSSRPCLSSLSIVERQPSLRTSRWSIQSQTRCSDAGGHSDCRPTFAARRSRCFTARTTKCRCEATARQSSRFMIFPCCCILTRMKHAPSCAGGCVLPRMARKATLIITDSEAVRCEVCEHLEVHSREGVCDSACASTRVRAVASRSRLLKRANVSASKTNSCFSPAR